MSMEQIKAQAIAAGISPREFLENLRESRIFGEQQANSYIAELDREVLVNPHTEAAKEWQAARETLILAEQSKPYIVGEQWAVTRVLELRKDVERLGRVAAHLPATPNG